MSAFAGGLPGQDHAGFVAARATALKVNAGANRATATSIESTCSATGDGSTGATVIQGGMLDGRPFGNGTPAPNTVIDVPGLGTVTLNEQIRTDVPGSASITLNAVHARYAPGPEAIAPRDGESAEAIIGQVVCRAVGPDVNVPTTTTTPPTETVPTTAIVPVVTTPVQTLPRTGSDTHLRLGVLALGSALALRLLSGKNPSLAQAGGERPR